MLTVAGTWVVAFTLLLVRSERSATSGNAAERPSSRGCGTSSGSDVFSDKSPLGRGICEVGIVRKWSGNLGIWLGISGYGETPVSTTGNRNLGFRAQMKEGSAGSAGNS